jgi:hypothetical protein
MADGKIAREDVIGSPLEEDLKVWRHSGLGRRIVQEELDTLAKLGIDKKQAQALRELFTTTNSS